jgi:flagellar biosynthetic protein FliQ
VSGVAMQLYDTALQTALVLALPVVALVAFIGVVTAIAQTVVGISDQNISFGPKLAAVAAVLAVGGMPALELLASLLRTAIMSLPRLVA